MRPVPLLHQAMATGPSTTTTGPSTITIGLATIITGRLFRSMLGLLSIPGQSPGQLPAQLITLKRLLVVPLLKSLLANHLEFSITANL